MLDFAVRDIHPQDALIVGPLIQQDPPPCMGRESPRSRMTIVSSTHMNPGKRRGSTA